MLGYNKPTSERASDNAIMRKLKSLSPLSVAADLRISLFVRVVVTASVQLLLVLAAAYGNPRCWVGAAIADLDRLARTTDKHKDYVGVSCAEWVTLIKASPSDFRKLISYSF